VRTLDELLSDPPDLPVVAVLDQVARAAARPGASLVLTAPPGTGKTTLLPPALACALAGGRVVVTQPRRVAVRAAARRIAALLHEEVGGSVGYSVRGDSRTSPSTRIEMVTPGVLLRRLQRDPDLPGIRAVVLDEFHERQLDTDLALALLLDVRAGLREDLVLALTSATLEAERTGALLGAATGGGPVRIDVPGVLHPLDVRWAPPPRGAEAMGVSGPDGRIGVRREFLAHVARTVRATAAGTHGDILVFLPGVREIEQVRAQLGMPGVDVLPLHGSLSPADQDRVLSGSDRSSRRRVVLSTAIAESSLTVPGVRVVVDAALSREPRTDVARGIPMLVTVPASRARCEQRAGRAARLGPGVAVRCLAEADWARRPIQSRPEIQTADLTDALLQCSAWGSPGMSGLSFLDPPPRGALEAAGSRLRSLGAIDEGGRATPLGRRLAMLPVGPPAGRALLESAPRLGTRRAARLVALLEEGIRAPGADLGTVARRAARGEGDPALLSRVREQARRLERLADPPDGRAPATTRGPSPSEEEALALVAALAHPGWLARRRPGTDRYLLADGMGAVLPPSSPLSGQEWLAVAELQRGQGRADGVIRAAAPLGAADAEQAGDALVHEDLEADLEGGRIRARAVRRLGSIEMSSRPLGRVPEEEGARLVASALARRGLDLLPWPGAARSLRDRMAVLHAVLGDPWPDVSEEALLARMRDGGWMGAGLARVARGGSLAAVDTVGGLRALLPWPEAARLDELAPQRLPIPTGAMRALDWSQGGQPVLSLRVQEAFGWLDTPTVADGRVPVLLHLLDPAGRPVAVTADLRSFWAGPYREVRAQLRGRYPRHPWPENPAGAEPTSRAKRRERRR
jgi:ATP-dependent helicase HrpB